MTLVVIVSKSDRECENDECELREAFNKLFKESSSLKKLVAQLINENKELLIKLSNKSDNSIEDVELLEINSILLDENHRLREIVKQLESSSMGSSLEKENQVLKQKVNSLDLKLRDLRIILNKKKNRKVEKKKLIEEKEILAKKILELEKHENFDNESRILKLEEKSKL